MKFLLHTFVTAGAFFLCGMAGYSQPTAPAAKKTIKVKKTETNPPSVEGKTTSMQADKRKERIEFEVYVKKKKGMAYISLSEKHQLMEEFQRKKAAEKKEKSDN